MKAGRPETDAERAEYVRDLETRVRELERQLQALENKHGNLSVSVRNAVSILKGVA